MAFFFFLNVINVENLLLFVASWKEEFTERERAHLSHKSPGVKRLDVPGACTIMHSQGFGGGTVAESYY